VAKLNKALYGLKQSPRLFYQFITNIFVNKLGFEIIPIDEGVFIHPEKRLLIACHVDDLLVAGPTNNIIKDFEKVAKKYLNLECLGALCDFLGNTIQINYDRREVVIHQRGYTNKIINKYCLKEEINTANNNNPYNKYKYPPRIKPGYDNLLKKNTGQATPTEILQFQKEIGSLLFLALKSRPDIAYNVTQYSKYASNPSQEHFKALQQIWGYLIRFPNYGIRYICSGNLALSCYTDSDWGADLDTRRSTTGYLTSLGPNNSPINLISWSS